MLAESGLYNSLQAHAVSTTGQPMCLYGDPAYPLLMHLQGPFRQRLLTPQQQAYNSSMSAVRCSVEWLFSDILNYFKFLDFKRNLKIGLSQVGKMYIVFAILQNVWTCLYGNSTSQFFWPRSTFSRELFFLIMLFCNHPTQDLKTVLRLYGKIPRKVSQCQIKLNTTNDLALLWLSASTLIQSWKM